jgi:hypothetical protein
MGKRRVLEPVPNDWLYSCPIGVPAMALVSSIGTGAEPVTELSARGWEIPDRMARAILEAYGGLAILEALGPTPAQPGPDTGPLGLALDDFFLGKCWHSERDSRGNIASSRFRGEIVIIRDISPSSKANLAHLVDEADFKLRWIRRRRRQAAVQTNAKIAVILEGWREPTFVARTGHKIVLVVNPIHAGI